MEIKDVKFSYVDKKLRFGPYIDFISRLTVESTDYEDIVKAIEKQRSDCADIKVMCFTVC